MLKSENVCDYRISKKKDNLKLNVFDLNDAVRDKIKSLTEFLGKMVPLCLVYNVEKINYK